MANHFPPTPADFAISGVNYSLTLPAGGAQPASGSPLYFDGSVVQEQMSTPNLQGSGYQVVFVTPGNVGTFDQDTVENALVAYIDNICQALATTANVTVASLKSQCSIMRQLSWTSPSTGLGMYSTGFVTVT